MRELVLVGIGGFFGAITRYLIGLWAAGRFGVLFPYGTLIINVSGSFLLGFAVSVLVSRFGLSTPLRLMLATGYLGAYTTFSTFTLETLALLEAGQVPAAAGYMAASLAAGLAAVALGQLLGRILINSILG